MIFNKALLTANSLVLAFPRKNDVRRDIIAIEDALRSGTHNHYKQPALISIPDEMDPQMPRIIFESSHGFSQVIISQTNIALNVQYSPDWQNNYQKGQEYISERAHLLFDIIGNVFNKKAIYTGLASIFTINTPSLEEKIIEHLYRHYQKCPNNNLTHDFEIKTTNIVDNLYFSNLQIKNFREWPQCDTPTESIRYKRSDAVKRGIQIIGDFNDRYGFNEIDGYETNVDTYKDIMKKSFSIIDNEIRI